MRETIDSEFLRRNFAQSDGNLYEGSLGVDITDVAGLDPKTHEKKNDTSALQRLATVVAEVPDSEFIQRVSELVDLEEFFIYWAVEVIVFHWDGYALGGGGFGSQSPNYYYVYLTDPDGRFVFLPWGADTTLGAGIPPYQYPLIPSLQEPNPGARFASRVYAIAEGRDRLRKAVLSVVDRAWDSDQLIAETNAIAELVRGNGLTSSREESTIETFEAEVRNRQSFIASRSAMIHMQLAL
jgi:hypothetical protein